MPTLPSGLRLALGDKLILKTVERNFFSCPEGHFWYKNFDEPPPGGYWDTQGMFAYAHAEVPTTIEELSPYIQVLVKREDDSFYWKGDVLSDFPRYIELSSEDLAAWNVWIRSPELEPWLLGKIETCYEQSIEAQKATGFLVVDEFLKD